MTTDSQITQCPKCDTTFRITPAQLKVAKGAVRCGACLHVFRASDHFQAAKTPEPEKQDDRTADMFGSEAQPAKPAEQPSQNLAQAAQSKAESASTPEPEPESGVLDELADSGLIEDEDDFLIDDDNGLIDDNFIDDHDENTGLGELNEEFLSLNADDPSDPFHHDVLEHHESIKVETGDDEDWAQALLNDVEEEEAAPTKKSAPTKKAKPVKSSLNSPAQEQSQADDGIVLSRPAGNQFSYIQQDPLELALPEKKSKLPFLLWSFASLLLLATFIGQAAYFNFDQWARYDQYRPYYQLACQQLSCTLPSTYDVSKIRTTASPQVSSHTKYKNTLTVDILFMNDAPYPQAFPRLELSFSDNNDKIVAHRLFKPDEYLAGEAAGLNLMPTQTPIHIALEIQDPGKNASNYQVRFLAP